MTRPRGFIRQTLHEAAWSLAREQQAFHWRELMHHAGLAERLSPREQETVRQVVKNMQAAGELRPVGTVRAEHACRPMVLLQPAGRPVDAAGQGAELAAAVRCWAEFK